MTNILTHPVILALGNALVSSMLQGLILFFIAAPLIFLFGKRKPEVAHWISMAALTLMLAGFTYSLIGGINVNPMPSPQEETIPAGSVAVAAEIASTTTYMQVESRNYQALLPYIALMYVMGLLFFVIRFMAAFYNIRLLRMKGLEKIPDYIHEIYLVCAEKTNISKKVNLFLSSRIKSPVCFGYIKPVILFPVSAITQLSHEEIELIILHELAHIKRHDYLLKILQSTVQTILFFNPFCYFFSRQAELTRELCCDKVVIKMKNQKFRYAQTLLKLEEIKLSLTNPVLTIKPNQNQIMNRIKNIMENKPQNPISRVVSLAFILITLAALSVYSINTEKISESELLKADHYTTDFSGEQKPAETSATTSKEESTERKVIRMEASLFGEVKFSDEYQNQNITLHMKDGHTMALKSDLSPYTTDDVASVFFHRPLLSSDLHIFITWEEEPSDLHNKNLSAPDNTSGQITPAQEIMDDSENQSTGTVKGTVKDHEGKPLAGAVVRVKETGQVYITGMEGNFILENISPRQTLLTSFTGHEKFEAKPIFDQPLEIRLKKDYTMPLVMVSTPDRDREPSSDSDGKINRNNILLFVDGRETPYDILSEFNPSDLVSIDVYRGDKAIDMFGERARTKDGVLYITTRKAGEKDPKTLKLEETIKDDPDYGQMPFAASVEVLPEFSEGSFRAWLSNNMRYPAEAKKDGIQGTVMVEFIIRKDGKIEQIAIHKGDHPVLYPEALRLVSYMPPWIPGRQGGEPVDVRFILPVEFILE
ncbi:MAG: TonB family protein [Bacteroidetes bacterium]|nr:MAG: TonB family protein [Bacteroidota bacterium]